MVKNMTASSDARKLEISVCNFGPIASGTIELRPMTVFVGAEQHRQVIFRLSDLRTS